jgi:hypothetical protein
VRCGWWLVVLAGCRTILGIDDPDVGGDAGSGHDPDASGPTDGRHGDGDSRDDAATPDAPDGSLFVQGKGVAGNGTATVAAAYAAAQQVGDLDLVVIDWTNGANVTGVTDAAGNSFQEIGPTVGTAAGTQSVWAATNIAASASNTVTATFSAAATGSRLTILEYRGIRTANPQESISISNGNGTTITNVAVSTTHAHDLLVAILSDTATSASTDPRYTARIASAGNLVEDQEVTATGDYDVTATLTPASPWSTWLIALVVAP